MQRRDKKVESRGSDPCRVGCEYITEITGLDMTGAVSQNEW